MTKKILVVDDSTLLHKMYDMALRAYPGCTIEPHFAMNGEQGLSALHEHPDVAVILLDVNMPAMSGLEFLQRVKAEPGFADVHVILQSTEDSRDDIERGLAAGARGYLTKPFTPQQVFDLLDEVLN